MDQKKGREVVFVTGPSGAGRSTAINTLEDFGFEAIDNMPLRLVDRLLERDDDEEHPLALGIDPRTRDFSPEALRGAVERARRIPALSATLLYVDCSLDVLLNRYNETRRRHPLARNEDPKTGITRELDLMKGLRDFSDVVIDTTQMSPHDLRRDLARWFGKATETELSILVQSFSYKRGVPRGADLVFDMRFLRNPHWEPALREFDGRDAPVANYVQDDPLFSSFFDKLADMLTLLLPAYKTDGKAYLSIGLGCTGGQHRSVAVTEKLAKELAEDGWQVSIRHRELELRGLMDVRERK